ncbi:MULTISPECIES: DUF1349 domain-containing protein [Rhodomicrobium]|uniref:DUF1349 domain-containing protein n=1 Tax=Rhodomicrobium TaxID=1068 RepID=UPI000B4A74D6|nr:MULTISPECIES: DUF1349 domain-containing protein [Rhodomicrobium]
MERVSLDGGTWLNRPSSASFADGVLTVATDAKTDFWRDTYYGFTRDSGHCLQFAQGSGFTAEIRVRGQYETLYDQAGLMVRLDERRWVKTGCELTDGRLFLSTVVTDGRSDWSVTDLAGDLSDIRLRVTVAGGSIRVQASLDGVFWPLLRLAPFPAADAYRVGPMAASPERAGFIAAFSDFRCGPPTTNALHDLT